MDSQTLMIVGITVAVCALIGVGVWFAMNQMRSRRLKERFGPEYDRTVNRAPDRDLAEAELQKREARVKKYKIVPLSEHDRDALSTCVGRGTKSLRRRSSRGGDGGR